MMNERDRATSEMYYRTMLGMLRQTVAKAIAGAPPAPSTRDEMERGETVAVYVPKADLEAIKQELDAHLD